MAIIKCKMCGGNIEISADKTFGTCGYCGSTMTLPKTDDDQRLSLFNRGTHLRRNGEFDKAASRSTSTRPALYMQRALSPTTRSRPSGRSIWTTAACTTTLNAARTFMRPPKSQKLSKTSSRRSPSVSAQTQSFSKTTRLCESSSAPARASSPRCCKTKKKSRNRSVLTFSYSQLLFELLERAAHGNVLLLHRLIERLYAFRQLVLTAQRFRHLRAGVGERAEAKVQRHALERVHRAERRV